MSECNVKRGFCLEHQCWTGTDEVRCRVSYLAAEVEALRNSLGHCAAENATLRENDVLWRSRMKTAEAQVQRVREVCEDKYVGPATTYGEGFQNGYNDALYRVLRALNGLCPICSGPIRETVGLVCQTCGTDYGASDE